MTRYIVKEYGPAGQQKVAQTSCFPRPAAFLEGTEEEPHTCKRCGSALLLVPEDARPGHPSAHRPPSRALSRVATEGLRHEHLDPQEAR